MLRSEHHPNLFDPPEVEDVATPVTVMGIDVRQPGWPDRFGEALRDWSRTALQQSIPMLSLFSGAGGLDIGFADCGFHAGEMVEIDERFVNSLRANVGTGAAFAGSNPQCVDVRRFDPAEGRIDMVIGGPPCQSFSSAGRRAGGVKGATDDRGKLFRAYVRLLEQTRPKVFLFENVYGITGANGGEDWREIKAAFEEAGYVVYSRVLDAADFGVPQHRERMFIVGVRSDLGLDYRFPAPTHGPDSASGQAFYSAGLAVEGVESPSTDVAPLKGKYGHLLSEVPPGLNYSYFTKEMGHPRPVFSWRSKFSDFLYKADPVVPIRTLKAQGGQYTGPFHWDSRPFNAAELKRLQTFPDDYILVGSRAVAAHQIGNSVPPQLARILALSVLKQVFGLVLPFDLRLLEPEEPLGFRTRKRQRTMAYARSAAESLIVQPQVAGKPTTFERRYCSQLGGDFSWTEVSGEGVEVQLRFGSDEWSIRLTEESGAEQGFEIVLEPTGAWDIPTRRIKMSGNRLVPAIFTSVWKALEHELSRLGLKADLVQLSGYFQYEQSFAARMSYDVPREAAWEAVAKVVAGCGVRKTLPVEAVAERWEVGVEDVWAICAFLRELGYEVRGNSTNPQIKPGSILIPYTFPTLAPRSVQRHKRLEIREKKR